VITAFFVVANWLTGWRGSEGAVAAADAGASAPAFLADVLGRAVNAIEFGLVVVFAIFCFRAVLRKDWLASAAAAVLFTLSESGVLGGDLVNFFFFLVIFTLLVFVLLRLGLVATIVSVFFTNNLLRTPGAQGLTKPYEWAVVAYPVMLVIIVIWAFWRTSGQQLLTVKAEES